MMKNVDLRHKTTLIGVKLKSNRKVSAQTSRYYLIDDGPRPSRNPESKHSMKIAPFTPSLPSQAISTSCARAKASIERRSGQRRNNCANPTTDFRLALALSLVTLLCACSQAQRLGEVDVLKVAEQGDSGSDNTKGTYVLRGRGEPVSDGNGRLRDALNGSAFVFPDELISKARELENECIRHLARLNNEGKYTHPDYVKFDEIRRKAEALCWYVEQTEDPEIPAKTSNKNGKNESEKEQNQGNPIEKKTQEASNTPGSFWKPEEIISWIKQIREANKFNDYAASSASDLQTYLAPAFTVAETGNVDTTEFENLTIRKSLKFNIVLEAFGQPLNSGQVQSRGTCNDQKIEEDPAQLHFIENLQPYTSFKCQVMGKLPKLPVENEKREQHQKNLEKITDSLAWVLTCSHLIRSAVEVGKPIIVIGDEEKEESVSSGCTTIFAVLNKLRDESQKLRQHLLLETELLQELPSVKDNEKKYGRERRMLESLRAEMAKVAHTDIVHRLVANSDPDAAPPRLTIMLRTLYMRYLGNIKSGSSRNSSAEARLSATSEQDEGLLVLCSVRDKNAVDQAAYPVIHEPHYAPGYTIPRFDRILYGPAAVQDRFHDFRFTVLRTGFLRNETASSIADAALEGVTQFASTMSAHNPELAGLVPAVSTLFKALIEYAGQDQVEFDVNFTLPPPKGTDRTNTDFLLLESGFLVLLKTENKSREGVDPIAAKRMTYRNLLLNPVDFKLYKRRYLTNAEANYTEDNLFTEQSYAVLSLADDYQADDDLGDQLRGQLRRLVGDQRALELVPDASIFRETIDSARRLLVTEPKPTVVLDKPMQADSPSAPFNVGTKDLSQDPQQWIMAQELIEEMQRSLWSGVADGRRAASIELLYAVAETETQRKLRKDIEAWRRADLVMTKDGNIRALAQRIAYNRETSLRLIPIGRPIEFNLESNIGTVDGLPLARILDANAITITPGLEHIALGQTKIYGGKNLAFIPTANNPPTESMPNMVNSRIEVIVSALFGNETTNDVRFRKIRIPIALIKSKWDDKTWRKFQQDPLKDLDRNTNDSSKNGKDLPAIQDLTPEEAEFAFRSIELASSQQIKNATVLIDKYVFEELHDTEANTLISQLFDLEQGRIAHLTSTELNTLLNPADFIPSYQEHSWDPDRSESHNRSINADDDKIFRLISARAQRATQRLFPRLIPRNHGEPLAFAGRIPKAHFLRQDWNLTIDIFSRLGRDEPSALQYLTRHVKSADPDRELASFLNDLLAERGLDYKNAKIQLENDSQKQILAGPPRSRNWIIDYASITKLVRELKGLGSDQESIRVTYMSRLPSIIGRGDSDTTDREYLLGLLEEKLDLKQLKVNYLGLEDLPIIVRDKMRFDYIRFSPPGRLIESFRARSPFYRAVSRSGPFGSLANEIWDFLDANEKIIAAIDHEYAFNPSFAEMQEERKKFTEIIKDLDKDSEKDKKWKSFKTAFEFLGQANSSQSRYDPSLWLLNCRQVEEQLINPLVQFIPQIGSDAERIEELVGKSDFGVNSNWWHRDIAPALKKAPALKAAIKSLKNKSDKKIEKLKVEVSKYKQVLTLKVGEVSEESSKDSPDSPAASGGPNPQELNQSHDKVKDLEEKIMNLEGEINKNQKEDEGRFEELEKLLEESLLEK